MLTASSHQGLDTSIAQFVESLRDRCSSLYVTPTKLLHVATNPYSGERVEKPLESDVLQGLAMLKAAGARFDFIALDLQDAPPPTAQFLYHDALALLSPLGHGVAILSQENLERILQTASSRNIYALVETDDAKAFIACFDAGVSQASESLTSSPADLPKIAKRLRGSRYLKGYTDADDFFKAATAIKAVQNELSRIKNGTCTISLKGKALQVHLSEYNKLALGSDEEIRRIERLHGQRPSFFAIDVNEWRTVQRYEREHRITISTEAKEAIDKALRSVEVLLAPLYPVKPAQALGFLDDVSKIRCTKDDPSRGFEAGKYYPITTSTRVVHEYGLIEKVKPDGERQEIPVLRERKALSLTIGGNEFDEILSDITYIIEHFEIPIPQPAPEREPERFIAMQRILKAIENKFNFKLRGFQHDGIARLLLKGRGLLAWQPGLGKTVAALAFSVAKAIIPRFNSLSKSIQMYAPVEELVGHLFTKPVSGVRALIVVPQSLMAQWQAQAERFLGMRFREIHAISDARALKHLPDFWAITHYEALSRTGAVLVQNAAEEVMLRVKPAYAHIPKLDILIVDESHYLKGQSLRSKAVRGLKARSILGLTGTPLKEYVRDCFWPLARCLGYNSPLFPFSYHGRQKFTDEFGVKRWRLDENRRRTGQAVTEARVSNLSRLWRILCTNTLPMALQDCGEKLVEFTKEIVRVPFGTHQQEMYYNWLLRFPEYFRSAHPNTTLSDKFISGAGILLGQGIRLQFACSLPEANPMWSSSNRTPKNLFVLEKATELVRQGERVVIFSNLRAAGPWFAEQLRKKGVLAEHITNGNGNTLPPSKRAEIIKRFKNGEFQVLCAGVDALGEGHDLKEISSLILHSFGWSHSSFWQAISRVRRLTSPKQIRVFIPIIENSIEEEILKLIMDKTQAAYMVLFAQPYEQGGNTNTLQKLVTGLAKRSYRI